MAITSKKNTEKHLKNGYVPRVGISYAVDEHGNRIYVEEATPGREYFCEARCGGCEGKLIVKNQGKINAHHFAKKSRTDCLDKWNYDMSPWHRAMQGLFPPEWREVVMEGKDGTWHRADVMNKEKHVVVEFQHSPISTDEFNERNRFYTENGYSVVWVVDAGMEDEHIKNMDNQRIGYDTANNTGISFFHFRNRKKTYDEVSLHDRKGVSLFFWVGKWRSLKEKDTVLTASLKGSFILPVWTQGFSGNDYSYFAGKKVFLRSFVSRVTNGTIEDIYVESEEDLLKYSNAVAENAETRNKYSSKDGYTASASHCDLMYNRMRYGLLPDLFILAYMFSRKYGVLTNWYSWSSERKINLVSQFLDDMYIKYRFGTRRSKLDTVSDILLFIDDNLSYYILVIANAGLTMKQSEARIREAGIYIPSIKDFIAKAVKRANNIRNGPENNSGSPLQEIYNDTRTIMRSYSDDLWKNVNPCLEHCNFNTTEKIWFNISMSCFNFLEKRNPMLTLDDSLFDASHYQADVCISNSARITNLICPYCGRPVSVDKQKIINAVKTEFDNRRNSADHQIWADNKSIYVNGDFTCDGVLSGGKKCDATFECNMEFGPDRMGDAVPVKTDNYVVNAIDGTIYNDGVIELSKKIAEKKFYLISSGRLGHRGDMPEYYNIENIEDMMEEICGIKLADGYKKKVTEYIRAFVEYCELKICAYLRVKDKELYSGYADGYWLSRSISGLSSEEIENRLANLKITKQLRQEANVYLSSVNIPY